MQHIQFMGVQSCVLLLVFTWCSTFKSFLKLFILAKYLKSFITLCCLRWIFFKVCFAYQSSVKRFCELQVLLVNVIVLTFIYQWFLFIIWFVLCFLGDMDRIFECFSLGVIPDCLGSAETKCYFSILRLNGWNPLKYSWLYLYAYYNLPRNLKQKERSAIFCSKTPC